VASDSSIGVPGVTFLLNDTALDDGIIFAFSAYIHAVTPVRLQVWRAAADQQTTNVNFKPFKLMWELRVVPTAAGQRQDVSQTKLSHWFVKKDLY